MAAALDDALQTSCRINGGNGTVLGSTQGHGSLANNNQTNEEQKLPSSWFMNWFQSFIYNIMLQEESVGTLGLPLSQPDYHQDSIRK